MIMKTISPKGLQVPGTSSSAESIGATLDPAHPESIAKLEAEAMSCLELEQFERGTNMLLQVLKIRRRRQGDNNPLTIQTMFNLALGCEGQGKLDHAIKILDTSLKYLTRSNGDVNTQFRSPIEARLSNLREKKRVASMGKWNNSLDQIATGVRSEETPPIFYIDSNTTPEAIVAHLTDQRCPNLTDMIDPARCSKVSVDSGGYTDIWQGMLVDGRPIAMKRQRERKMNTRLVQGLYAWSKTDHKNVLELLGIAYYKDSLAMISPWMSYGSTHDYIELYPDANRLHTVRRNTGNQPTMGLSVLAHLHPLNQAIQVADGIAHLHRIGVIHGNIKAQNVFVSQEGVAKVAGFGQAIMLDERGVEFQPSGPGADLPNRARWMAPEQYKDSISTSRETDIYSLGMEIVSHRVPFSELHVYAVPAAVCIEKKIPTFPSEIKAMGQRGLTLWDLLRKCWDHNPKQRPTANEVLRELRKVASH
ncbi:hypothetical protein FRC11_012201 [Ceratobasidium sp. 423]|nr:hypothetical protein FRC11_012201 [Ceratobasidium sp. 423]